MKVYSLIFAAIIMLALPSCAPSNQTESSSTIVASSQSDTELSIEALSEKNNAMVGEYEKAYAFPPQGGFSVLSITRHDEFDVGSKVLKNVIALDIVADFQMAKDFMSEDGYAFLLDEYNNQESALSSGVYRDRANDKIYILIYSDNAITDYTYICLGGLEKNKYEKTRLLYKIDN